MENKITDQLIAAFNDIGVQTIENEQRTIEIIGAIKKLAIQNNENEKVAMAFSIALKELTIQNRENEILISKLLLSNKEYINQNEEKEQRVVELIVANKELEQFAFMVSHDLREPLRTVSNYMQVFEEDYLHQLDDNARNYLHSVKNAIARMNMLIKSSLEFARLGHNPKLMPVDFKQLIEEVIADLGSVIKGTNSTVEVSEMPTLNVHETLIGQVFQNLITNAIKFQERDTQPKIQIFAEKADELWKFAVRDNGIGIDPIHFERVFEIFKRLHINQKAYEGTGIGLASCKKIIQLHHGDIWVEANTERGSTFYFTLPI